MTQRIATSPGIPKAYRTLIALSGEVTQAGTDAGVDPKLIGLIKMRASQINGCAFCLDMHATDTLKLGEDPRRLFVLDAWRETDLYTEQERSALELTEVLTRLPSHQDVPDEVYERAVKVFDEAQYQVVIWMIVVINSFNRVAITGRKPLPRRES